MNPESEALICARASDWIYGSDTDQDGMKFCQNAMIDAGFDKRTFLWFNFETPLRDICAFAATSKAYHILAFRGTKLPQDWLVNLACTAEAFEDVFPGTPAIGEIHSGFGRCLAPGLDAVKRILKCRTMGKPLLITGHSLGGALASLTAAYFAVTRASVPKVRKVYTFGQPRVGFQKFCTSYGKFVADKLIRFVNDRDLVPRVPLRCQNYVDNGAMIHFDSSGIPHIDSSEWSRFLETPFPSLMAVIETIKNAREGITDHSMRGYRELIERNQVKLATLLSRPGDCRLPVVQEKPMPSSRR
jgi:triacylglycerol lipase